MATKNKIFLLFLFCSVTAVAQDRLFTYTYQSTVLNKGQKELEVWNTLRTGRDNYYARLDHRTEYEVGLGNNLQTAFYLNLTAKSAADSVQVKTENKIGFSNEWKLKLLDPVAHPIGLALYGEYTISTNEYELEGKLILDKRIHNLTVAFNGVYEFELEPEIEDNHTEWEKKNKIDAYLAAAWSVSPTFALTAESAWKNVLEKGEVKHSALFGGIGFSYVSESFWANFTLLPQLTSFKGAASGNSLNLKEFERIQCRLIFSYVF
ncbi:MAG: hypothetical protein WHT29_07625 [Bacteroidales bacterium]|nr:hypothetical protein [Bacteroidales bacterium]HOK99201.1 hypothetical protein [Bacteroidales bacterium]HPO65080.1 hypothetical protein [Bacteroidales bacterium]